MIGSGNLLGQLFCQRAAFTIEESQGSLSRMKVADSKALAVTRHAMGLHVNSGKLEMLTERHSHTKIQKQCGSQSPSRIGPAGSQLGP